MRDATAGKPEVSRMPDPVSSHTAAEHRWAVSSLEGQPSQAAGHSRDHPPELETVRSNQCSHHQHHSGQSVRVHTDEPFAAPVLDVDAAAIEIERRQDAWRTSGLTVAPMTWHEFGSWPPTTERRTVVDPDSVGVKLGEETGPYAHIILFRYGWVDLDIVNWDTEDVEATTGTPIADVEEFGTFLDAVFARLSARAQRDP